MHTDGQLYRQRHESEGAKPPPGIAQSIDEQVCVCEKHTGGMQEELILIGLIILLIHDSPDMPLILALAYILLAK